MIAKILQKLFPKTIDSLRRSAQADAIVAMKEVHLLSLERMKGELSEEKKKTAEVIFPVTFDTEFQHMMGFYKNLDEDDEDAIRIIVNSESYLPFRKYIQLNALNFFREGRETKDANITTVLNNIGKAFLNFALEIDSKFLKREDEESSFPQVHDQ